MISDTIAQYETLKRAIEAAGYFAIVEHDLLLDGEDHRVVCVSHQRPTVGYCGTSFWVAYQASNWYVGAWGGNIYRLPASHRIDELCTAWFRSADANAGAPVDVPEKIRSEFDLNLLSADEMSSYPPESIDDELSG